MNILKTAQSYMSGFFILRHTEFAVCWYHYCLYGYKPYDKKV